MKRQQAGLIGYPVEHSISPPMQQAAFDELKIPVKYALWPTPPREVETRVSSLRAADIIGANVTVPHKLAVMNFLDDISPLAQEAGAVNTVINTDGHLQGENTDVPGLARAIEQEGFSTEHGRQAVILGAGGAARAAVLALATLGFARIAIYNRTLARATALSDDLAKHNSSVLPNEAALHEALSSTDLVLNATSIGWRENELPLSQKALDLIVPSALVVDLTYRETPLLASCRERGLHVLDGLPMLVYQGAHSFELWTHRTAPVQTLMAAAIAARAT